MTSAESLYDLSFVDNHGETVALADYAGRPVLIVNTASRCGYTHHYDGLQRLHEVYGPQGLVVLGFPCNQFLQQEPGTDAEIEEFCRLDYGVTFPLSTKVEVNGDDAHPVFSFLKERTGGEDVPWNFEKFLVEADGVTVHRYNYRIKPDELTDDVVVAVGDSAA